MQERDGFRRWENSFFSAECLFEKITLRNQRKQKYKDVTWTYVSSSSDLGSSLSESMTTASCSPSTSSDASVPSESGPLNVFSEALKIWKCHQNTLILRIKLRI